MPPDILQDHIEAAFKWASEMSKIWTDTTIGYFLERGVEELEEAIISGDMDASYAAMINLVESCDYAETELRKV